MKIYTFIGVLSMSDPLRRYTYTAFLCFALVLINQLSFAQSVLDKKINIVINDATLKESLGQITRVSGIKFTFNEEVANDKQKLSARGVNKPLRILLSELLKSTRYSFTKLGSEVLIRIDQKNQKVYPGAARTDMSTQSYAISGSIKSARTGETIPGGTIMIAGLQQGTSTNDYGFYSLRLPQGNYSLIVSAIGFKERQLQVSLSADSTMNFALDESSYQLAEVKVTGDEGNQPLNAQMGLDKVSVRETSNIPVLFGERDILKTIQLLPGVKAAGEGSSGFYVRGGAADQNLILLDEAPVYNASHLMGFFSTFNSDAIKNASIYKGGMPAQYGGRLSSVLDIKMNDGNNQQLGVSGGIGLIASRLNVEAPIQKGRSSFLISGRRTYVDQFLKLSSDTAVDGIKLYFYDLNVKANYQINNSNRLYISGYFGQDVLSSDDLGGINWGNATGTLRWNHIFNNRVFSNTSLILSNYDYKINVNLGINKFNIFSQIRDWNFKEDVQWNLNNRNTLSFGLNSIYHTIKPGEISAQGVATTVRERLQNQYSVENAVYISNAWSISNKLSATYGLRVPAFTILGKGNFYTLDLNGEVLTTKSYKSREVVKTYINFEPRLALGWEFSPGNSVKASYVRNTQNLHLISNSTAESPTDKWVGSTNLIKPETADQFSLGFYKKAAGNVYEFSTEAYYKTMSNQIDYRPGADVFTNAPIETQLLYGKGRAYGIEFLAKKKAGALSGWLSYTLSKTERQINGINNNNWYNARQDRTHDVVITAMYQVNPKWALSANWVFYTGDAVTFPSGKYRVDDQTIFYFTERNGYRMPNYQRLDLGATRQLKQTKTFSSELILGLYNAYGYNNAYRITFRESKTVPDKAEALRTTLFKYVPSITYNFKF
ncbi:TonB-dependent receptor [Daejeonella lutea]|uniref:TonB-dependent Receptor Plug Domain n=1 Tax=Daejeonella lutea TaxID=572036 RepID=A0A1T5BRB8_9SPHI|nr:TonB-dependent receptor [Daejeonella lutea]SKB49767.1 TonB-dependent Receptor Plug Domain [Daejeonella lutea]